MGWFKRLCLFVYGLAGLLALAALMLPWVGPYTQEAAALLTGNLDYWYAVLAVVAITGLGALISLLRSLFTPRNRKMVTVSRVDGGQITVTRTAIASQSKHIVEKDGTCVAANTRVRVRKHSVKVRMKVTPKHALNVVTKGAELHDELVQGLQGVCGDTLKDVSLVFTDPQSFEDDKPDYLSTTYAGYAAGDEGATGSSDAASATPSYLPGEGSQDDAGAETVGEAGPLDGITVPLRPAHHEEAQTEAAELASSVEPATEVAPATDAGEETNEAASGDVAAVEGDSAAAEAEGADGASAKAEGEAAEGSDAEAAEPEPEDAATASEGGREPEASEAVPADSDTAPAGAAADSDATSTGEEA